MAKDNRTIVRGVRIDGVVYRDGQEDEVADRLDSKDIKRLVKNGTLEGDWGVADSSDVGATATLTDSINKKLGDADIATDETLSGVSDDDLKAAGLTTNQVEKVRAVYGEYSGE